MALSSIPRIPFIATTFFIVLSTSVTSSEAALRCNDVIEDLMPCISYLRSGTGMPPSSCCAGVANLASSAITSADRQTACTCLKDASKGVNLKLELAKSLPENCGISLPFAVSPDVDCSKIT